MSETHDHDVIIIGGGPAGLTAGLYCKRAGLDAVLFEKGLVGGQIAVSKDVDNYPGVENVTGFDLADKLVHHASSFGLNIVKEEVAEILPGPRLHTVRLADGTSRRTVALILALGGTAKKLGIPGEAEYFGSGVSYCATCDGFFFRGKAVAIIGGGDNAVEEAIHMARLAGKVYLIHRRDTLRASRLLQERLLSEPGIEVIWNTVVTAIHASEGTVSSIDCRNVDTGDTRPLAVQGVFIRIGFFPNNRLIPPAIRMNDEGFVVTDEKCATNISGIYAAGDLRQKYANQIVVAAADGCISALAAAHYIEESRGRRAG